jgi:trimethylamine:corrinoid methyltransferase-like protein
MLATTGCIPLLVGAAAGAGGIAFVKGKLEQNIDEPVEKVHEASVAALKDLGLFVKSEELNPHESTITAEYETGQKVNIETEALTEYVSKISIRVGLMGDQEESRLILSAIEKKL